MGMNSINQPMEQQQSNKPSALQNAATALGILGNIASVGLGAYNASTAGAAATKANALATAQTDYLKNLTNQPYLSGGVVPNAGVGLNPTSEIKKWPS